ncbi:MAG: AAA family ATPase [Gemmataceae bacterium]
MILEILLQPANALPYAALSSLQKISPASYILETDDSDFEWHLYAAAGLCECTVKPEFLEQALYTWSQEDDRPYRSTRIGYFDIQWQGKAFNLLQIRFETACGTSTHVWLVAEDKATAQEFFTAVCRWSTLIRDEIYVFEEGYWNKDEDLFQSIQSSRLDNLILPPGLKEAIRDDAATYFESRDRYARFNIPWKRGLILIGPPGNGKTHMIKALINDLKQPCLYVKSLKARYENEDLSIRKVFQKARASAPCILVMEDIDALIDNENRSFFLNELDGFRKNEGLLVIATTNHPEKLDPAIVDRPSRFDRKYHFDLPAVAERAAYLGWWNQQLEESLRLTDAGVASIAAAAEGFSFAYLKELAIASTMAWMNRQETPMDEIMACQLVGLREQMASVRPTVPAVAQDA